MPPKKDDPFLFQDEQQEDEILFAPEEPDEQPPENNYQNKIENNDTNIELSPTFKTWKILVVDDEEDVHVVTSMLFEGVDYQNKPVQLLDAYSGKEACEILAGEPDIALVFLDVVMETNHAGLEVVKFLRNDLHNSITRLILRTGQPGEAPESSVIMQYEIDDYKLKTELTAQKLITSLIGGLRAYGTLRSLEIENKRRRIAEAKLQEAYQKLDDVFEQTVISLSSTFELRDSYTAGHARNVGELAFAIAQKMALPGENCRFLRLAGYLHDIGKIKIPMDVLDKTEPLSDDDWEYIRIHPITGFEVLKSIDFPQPLARIVLEHHERYNGKGYPGNKSNNELLLESQILAVADVVEAMTLARPYRKALGRQKAIDEITARKGSYYHPQVVDACLEILKEGYEFE